MVWILELAHDVESDLHRFHGVLIDIDQDAYGGVPAKRLFEWIERLGAYDGAVAARAHALQEEAKKHNPSHATLAKPGTVVTDVISPHIADLVEYETV